jgi:hypothetical protein
MHPRSPPWQRVIVCQGNVRPAALKTSHHATENFAKKANAPQARLPRDPASLASEWATSGDSFLDGNRVVITIDVPRKGVTGNFGCT